LTQKWNVFQITPEVSIWDSSREAKDVGVLLLVIKDDTWFFNFENIHISRAIDSKSK
jgi:hypothetical protein